MILHIKTRLYRSHFLACSIRYEAANSHPDLKCHMPILEKLGISATSDDESDHEDGERRFRIVVPSWRSAELTKWLRYTITFIRPPNSTTPDDPVGVIDSDPRASSSWGTRVTKEATCGASTNFFKPGYLDSLLRYERDALMRRGEVYPLQHTEEIMA